VAKLDKAVVLYYPSKQVGTNEGTHCGKCMMFVRDHCTVVEGKIDGEDGTCGLYVFGKHMGPDMHGETPKSVVGYETSGPTHCGNCVNYQGDEYSGPCRIVEGTVEYLGCCNGWKEGKANAESIDPYVKENRRK